MDPAALAAELQALSGLPCAAAPAASVSGGSINRCYRWPAGAHSLFVKVAAESRAGMLTAEAEGLAALAAAGALRVPRVLARGSAGGAAFLALEWLDAVPAHTAAERALGEGLARLHAVTQGRFGFTNDNFIGLTPQRNGASDDWAEFFRERRLRPQLRLLEDGGNPALAAALEQLLPRVEALLAGHRPAPSLLHGDLWGGNWLALGDQTPVIYDPAVYYGDRETDLAMTRLFGGFGAAFYRAYHAIAPLAAGAERRAELYNLYHVLNHANLFGGGYLGQARALTERLLGMSA
jgi:protein-ribulosamine 3-kinase